ncbi:hypothetical protein SB11R_10240 [Pseudomonas oryzihabitans]|nr:hypothetical protein SB11R_10240 [Pseudomonas psychrotolerans]
MPSPLSPYMTLVIRMPAGQAAREALTGDLRVLIDLHGGEVTGSSLDDEMTLSERFEAALPPGEAEAIRQEHAAGAPLPGADSLEA